MPPPLPSQQSARDALDTILSALADLSEERADVRAALAELQAWIGLLPRRTDRSGARPRPDADAVLTPAPDRRTGSGRTGDAGGREERRVDLSLVARRAAWKGEAVRFAAERRRLLREGGETGAIREREEGLRKRRAGLPDAYPWMLDSPRPLPAEDLLEEVAACYDTIARAAEVVVELEAAGVFNPAPPAEMLYLLAEVQSALLAALGACEQRGDADQRDVFHWLKSQTMAHRIYVDRHMRLDDPAQGGTSAARLERLDALRKRLLGESRRRRDRGRLLGKVRYHAAKADEVGEARDQDWAAVVAACEEWKTLGLPPGDATLQRVLGAFDSEHRGDRERPPVVAEILEAPTAPVRPGSTPGSGRAGSTSEAARLLAGRRALVLAPEEREQEGAPALEKELRFAAVDWRELPPEGTEEFLHSQIGRDDVDLVLLGTRLSSEDYGELKRLCIEHDKPYVRLPTGTEPDRVAHQVLRQIGWRLRA